jgi:purine/pyrimidine-nucleoside phosphorylase
MSDFNGVSIAKAANILYDGNITSRAITFEDGSKKTLGIMLNGEYELTTVNKAIIEIQRGSVDLLLPAKDWQKFEGPASFEIPANSKYKLRVNSLVDYCCSFIKE